MKRTAVLALILVSVAPAQTTPSPKFDVASIKLTPPPDAGSGTIMSVGCDFKPDKIDCYETLKGYIALGYDLPQDRVSGPTWLMDQEAFQSDMFELVAKFPKGTSRAQVLEMLRNLLVERFHLAAHREDRETTVYALMVDGKAPLFKTSNVKPESRRTFMGMHGYFGGNHVTIADLVNAIKHQEALDHPILDRTNLKDSYEFSLTWHSNKDSNPPPPGQPPLPELSTALREQLGLKLVREKAPLEMVVVDHVEKTPSAN